MGTLASLEVKLGLDARPYTKNLGIADSANQKFGGSVGGMGDLADRAGSRLEGIGIRAGIGAAVTTKALALMGSALDFVTDQIGASAKAASDLGEQLSKSNVVFGAAAAGVERFGERAALALGISKRAALEAAGTFGNFFVGLGQSEFKAAQMSERLVTLAADLASFNNLDPTEVLDKLRAGLAGESEPLRRVGVFLTEAKVQAKAMELGLADVHGELSEGAKVLARYQLILDETTTAQGDYGRTATSVANQARRNAALIENAQARLGQNLLGIQSALQTGLAFLLDEQFRTEVEVANFRTKLAGETTDELTRIVSQGEADRTLVYKAAAARQLLAQRGLATSLEAMVHMADAAKDDMDIAADALARSIPDAVTARRADVAAETQKMIDGLAGSLRSGYDDVFASAQRLAEAASKPIDTATRLAALRGLLTGQELAAGLRSSDPIVRAESVALAAQIRDEMIALGLAARTYGLNTGLSFAAGMREATPAIGYQARSWADIVEKYVHVSSPAEKGPLSLDGGPGGWGEKLGSLFGAGIERTMPDLSLFDGFKRSELALGSPLALGPAGGAIAATPGGLPGGTIVVQLQGPIVVELDGAEVGRAMLEEQTFVRPQATFLPAGA